jgi:hypothetical protein
LPTRNALSSLSWIISLSLLTACGDDRGGGATVGNEGTDGETGAETGNEAGDSGGDEDFGPETALTLRISDDAPPPLQLDMGREEVAELFGDVADEIDLLELDSTPLLINTLDAIKFACGDDWQLDQQDPNHDCSLTPLGQSFGGGNWETSAEFSMVRILTMTPANSVVNGTSLESVQGVTDFFDFFTGGFSEMLAESLEIAVTDEFLDTQNVVYSLRQNLLATHPEIAPDGKITITLADALADMATLSTRLGPVGDHPGVLVSDYPTHGEVFGPDFQMSVVAESNLRVLDGVDLSATGPDGGGKDFISVIVDTTGPTFEDEAEFDFNDPEKFSLTGLTPNPALDLRFAIHENDEFIPACTTNISEACINNAPMLPIGQDLVWTLEPWEFEYIVAWAGRQKYAGLHSVVTKAFIDLVLVGQDGDPGGWAVFTPPEWLGVPPAQYVWEMINEVAQHDLHHLDPEGPATFPEGGADVEFTLEDIPCGVTGAEAAEAVRPFLQEQASDIAGYLLGNYKENSGPVDFYYRRGDDGGAYLFWVAADDLLDNLPYGWGAPGFYADAGLSEKLSSTTISGVADQAHEKLKIEPGETIVYATDDEGGVYKLRIDAPADTSEIEVYVSRLIN